MGQFFPRNLDEITRSWLMQCKSRDVLGRVVAITHSVTHINRVFTGYPKLSSCYCRTCILIVIILVEHSTDYSSTNTLYIFNMFSHLVKRSLTTITNGIISKSDVPTHPQRLFAVIHMLGRQYIVTPGDLISVDGHIPVEIGQRILINKCLILGGRDFSIIGRPIVDNDMFNINATVTEHTMSDVKCQYRHIPRNHGIRKYFFQSLPRTTFRINDIELNQLPRNEEMESITTKQ